MLFQKNKNTENDINKKLNICPNKDSVRGGGNTSIITEVVKNQSTVGISEYVQGRSTDFTDPSPPTTFPANTSEYNTTI